MTSKRVPGMPATGKRNRAPARGRERSDLEATGRRRRTIRVPGKEGNRSAPTSRGSDRDQTVSVPAIDAPTGAGKELPEEAVKRRRADDGTRAAARLLSAPRAVRSPGLRAAVVPARALTGQRGRGNGDCGRAGERRPQTRSA